VTRGGWLRTPAWQEAFQNLPRHVFLPRFFRLTPDGQRYEAIDQQHPDWLDLIYTNRVLATQLDSDDTHWQEAREHGPIEGTATSSSTQPSLMATMLEALDIRDDHEVLEVGPGTGYNAALLCHRLGDQHVTSIEYDAQVAYQARHALTTTGYPHTRHWRRRERLSGQRPVRPTHRHLLGQHHPTSVAGPTSTRWRDRDQLVPRARSRAFGPLGRR
jgi:protein-L-isoaspartate O-methyltransferase